MTIGNFTKYGPRQARVFSSGKNLIGVSRVKEIVRHNLSFGKAGFGCANIHAAIDLERVAIDDFAGEAACEMESQGGFSAGCRPDDYQQRRYTVRQTGDRLQRRTI